MQTSAAAESTLQLVHSLCSTIAVCKELQRAVRLLELAVDYLLDNNATESNSYHDGDGPDEQQILLASAQREFIEATKGGNTAAVGEYRAALFGAAFQELSDALLSVIAPNWLDRLGSYEAQKRLFYRWFDEAPPPTLLRALATHLSLVEPIRPSVTAHTFVTPVSAKIAINILSEKFGEGDSLGVASILRSAAVEPQARDDLLGLLAAIPDLAVVIPPDQAPHLQPTVFIPHVMKALLLMNVYAGDSTLDSTLDEESGGIGTLFAQVASNLISRLVRRGHASIVAQQIVANASSSNASKRISSVLEALPPDSTMETLLEAVFRQLPTQSLELSTEPRQLLLRLLPPDTWASRGDVRYVLGDKLLMQRMLPYASLALLLEYLDALARISDDDTITLDDPLAAAAHCIAGTWGKISSVRRLGIRHQAYLTSGLTHALLLLGRQRFQKWPGLLTLVLRGVGDRLESPLKPIRRQGMRVGNTMSVVLDPQKANEPVFVGEDTSLLPEESWERNGDEADGGKEKKVQGTRRQRKERRNVHRQDLAPSHESGILTETDSDDETKDDVPKGLHILQKDRETSSDSEFERYNVSDESDDDDPAKTNLQLRDLAKLLGKGEEDWKGHLRAIRSAETLICAAPDELAHYALPLSRALLYARLPGWAEEESAGSGDLSPEDSRFRALVALTSAVPEPVGLALAAEVYSPSMDTGQRARALAVLSTAAHEISAPGSFLKALGSSGISGRKIRKNTLRSSMPPGAGTVTRASHRSLEISKSSKNSRETHHLNKFPPVAVKWAAALLRECDVRRHGVDLFGRDSFILGRLIITLGSFLEASGRSPEAVPLAAAVIELVKAKQVHDSEEPYVRRAALMAVVQAIVAIPPPHVASSLISISGGDATGDVRSTQLGAQLEWLREWIASVEATDPDENCRAMASACQKLHGALASEALAALSESATLQPTDFMLPGRNPMIDVRLPGIQSLRLG